MPKHEGDQIASMAFLKRSDLYNTQKPYVTDFSTDQIPRSNFRTEMIRDVRVSDMRADGFPKASLQKQGFEVLRFEESSMSYEDWADQQKVEEVHCVEVARFLMHHFGAQSAQVFEATVRRRDSTFPYDQVDTNIRNQPAIRPHVDSSHETAIERIGILNDEETTAKRLERRWMYMNVWKPLRGPLRDWPLALCDPASITPGKDLLPADNVVRGAYAENKLLHYSPEHRWMYLSNQVPEELLLFRQADSDGSVGVPHVAFELPAEANKNGMRRESVEIRVFLYF